MIEALWPEILLTIAGVWLLWSLYRRQKIAFCIRHHLGAHTYTVLQKRFRFQENESADEDAGELICTRCRCVLAPHSREWKTAKDAMPDHLHEEFDTR